MFISAFLRRGFGGRVRATPDVTPPPPEVNTAPTTPTGLTQTDVATTTASFSWTGSTPTDALTVLGYKIYRDGGFLFTTTGLTANVTGLTGSRTYLFTVKSYTSALDSAASTPLSITTLADRVPNAFTFTPVTGASINTLTESNEVTITGISEPVLLIVTGGAEWNRNNTGWNSGTSSISDGQTLKVRITSSASAVSPVSTNVRVGGYVTTFTVTTGQGDQTPDPFPFTTQPGAALDTQLYSGFESITGINVAVPVTVTNGEWAKNGSALYVSTPGTVVNGDTVAVRHQSSALNNTAVTTRLDVGNGSSTFTSITLVGGGDDITPDPPFTIPYQTNLELNEVKVYGPIAITGISVPVNVSIGGAGNPQWSKDGVAWSAADGTIADGENFYIRATASHVYSDARVCGGYVGTNGFQYTLVTKLAPNPDDETPDQFTFLDQSGVNPNTVTQSNAVSISGINVPTAVSVTNGEWRIFLPVGNQTSYTSNPGSVVYGDAVRVRHTSAATHLTGNSTTLTVGGVSDTFTSTTKADSVAPSPPVLITVEEFGADGFFLTWGVSTDEFGVAGYRAYADTGSGPVQFYDGTSLQTSQINIPPSTTTIYTVKAYDAAGNLSAASNAISRTTAPPVNNNRTAAGAWTMDKFTWVAPGTVSTAGGAFAVTAVSSSGVADIVNEGQPVVISGAQFGSKVTVAPAVWDRCLGTNVNTIWDFVNPTAAPAESNLQYRNIGYHGVGGPHQYTTRYITGNHAGPSWIDANHGSNIQFSKILGVVPQNGLVYARCYLRNDPNWQFAAGGQTNNYKFFLWGIGTVFPAGGTYVYIDVPEDNWNNPTTNFTHKTRVNPLTYPDANGRASNWWFSGQSINNSWRLYEVQIKRSTTTSGYMKMWQGGTLVVDYAGQTDYGSAGDYFSCGYGGYSGSYVLGGTNQVRYFTDMYFDNTASRVMLCNNSNYNLATVREPQIPTQWTGTSITCTGNLGALVSDTTAYLFVVNASGAVSAGRPVTVGS